MEINILKLCNTCQEEKDIRKFQKNTRCCISCRNKKYYKKDYFKNYYEVHVDEIKKNAIDRYETTEKKFHPLKVGRPKKNSIENIVI